MFVTAVALDLMLASLISEVRHDTLNPSIALLPLTLLLFLAWCVGCGEYRLLPLTVVAASFVAQAHFTVAPASAAAVGVALVGLGPCGPSPPDARVTRPHGVICGDGLPSAPAWRSCAGAVR